MIAAVIAIFLRLIPANATTVALALLLVVLAASTIWGLAEAIFTSIIAIPAFNFFVPPVGTFTIADPQTGACPDPPFW